MEVFHDSHIFSRRDGPGDHGVDGVRAGCTVTGMARYRRRVRAPVTGYPDVHVQDSGLRRVGVLRQRVS